MRQDPFERLEPPPAGLAGLRRKLTARRVARTWLSLELTGVAVVLSLVLLADLWPAAPQKTDYGIFQAWMEGAQQREAITLLPGNGAPAALIPLESSDSRVRLYWIEEGDNREDE